MNMRTMTSVLFKPLSLEIQRQCFQSLECEICSTRRAACKVAWKKSYVS